MLDNHVVALQFFIILKIRLESHSLKLEK